jgi:hypothetical protein
MTAPRTRSCSALTADRLMVVLYVDVSSRHA